MCKMFKKDPKLPLLLPAKDLRPNALLLLRRRTYVSIIAGKSIGVITAVFSRDRIEKDQIAIGSDCCQGGIG